MHASDPDITSRRFTKDILLATRVTRADAATIAKRAAEAGLSKAEFLRQAALASKVQPAIVIPTINKDQWVEMSRQASNLHQIAAHLNAGGATSGGIPELLDKNCRLLADVRAGLIGAEVSHG
jgi:hypothetical protein